MRCVKTQLCTTLLLTVALAACASADDAYVRINRLGYRPADLKIAVAMGRSALSATFTVVDAATRKVVFEHDANSNSDAWGEFKNIARLDFSSVTHEGDYFIRIGDVTSPTFSIRDSTYAEL